MKKMMLVGALLLSGAALSGAAAFGQESRQDVSVSATGIIAPAVYGNAVQEFQTKTVGILASYRYMLTPHSALEANYDFGQYSTRFVTSSLPNVRVHTRAQEFSAAYVYSLNFHNFNPYAEAGPGAMFFSPIQDYGSTEFDTKRTTGIGGVFGAGVAYELSPSFDVRAGYRGFITKAPNFGVDNFKTSRYYVVSTPAIGIAYHF
jgi:outer membrane immunogenic protein